ncbi:hypothetical protein FB558_4973 [Pseudonocardia kunmingensis]|uniref:Uncharacterized protein n=1 Tax=Pseudonocardia kunmingensis TaxID=630975 RepID=A0A543DIS9_9PSEU|nr:hypothetical protein FB558_4973 [Pseudonocardia kunmingensis]
MTDHDAREDTGTEIRDDRARAFAEGLRRFERDADAAAFAGLFAEGAVRVRSAERGQAAVVTRRGSRASRIGSGSRRSPNQFGVRVVRAIRSRRGCASR